MNSQQDQTPIRARPLPDCRLCGNTGEELYRDQPDRLFDAPGLWTLKRCSNPECRVVWLDPMPIPEDLGKAYTSYYTHEVKNDDRRGLAYRSYQHIKTAYLARRFGYASSTGALERLVASALMHLFPVRRCEVEAEVRFLSAVPQGRLLDVGCGSGDWMRRMEGLGWQVEGLDFDERAVQVARGLGLKVRRGALEEQKYPAQTFDAVTLNHVIEHVPAPVETLRECARVLKPGGRLYLGTPNSQALGHRVFKAHWRGLEIPRHLHIFSPSSLERALKEAGFREVRVWTINSPYVWRQSIEIWSRRGGTKPGGGQGVTSRSLAAGLTMLAQIWLSVQRGAGECLSSIAVKD
jgi:2-polyprenyl-3-methyl-5-hydroxy-6-metoxy-1,4-benzoquinol methylase